MFIGWNSFSGERCGPRASCYENDTFPAVKGGSNLRVSLFVLTSASIAYQPRKEGWLLYKTTASHCIHNCKRDTCNHWVQ